MGKLEIVPIVEGHGEERAIPLLIEKWIKRHRAFDFSASESAINTKGNGKIIGAFDAVNHTGIEYWVKMACRKKPAGILIVVDSEDECEKRTKQNRQSLGPDLLQRARNAAPHIPIGVVVAHHMYEAWLLAALPEFQANGLLRIDWKKPPSLERVDMIKNSKKRIAKMLAIPYQESVHQLELTRYISFTDEQTGRSRSLQKFSRVLESLTKEARQLNSHASR